MMLKKYFSYVLLLSIALSIAYAAGGGGGGGGSSCGLCFSQSRPTILLYIKEQESKEMKLTNSDKFNIILNEINESKITIGFGEIPETFELNAGNKVSVDLNSDNFYDLEVNYVLRLNKNAQLRLKDLRNIIPVEKKKEIVETKKGIAEEKQKEEKESSGLKCGNLSTLGERVQCRLNLESLELEQELQLQYLPEECRALSGSEKGICIARYKSVQTCWKFPAGEKRISCVKKEINLGNIQDEKEKCNGLIGEEISTCIREAKNKVYNLIKWRFYDLEERAEDLMQRGLVDKDSVIDFVSKIEENKRKFNEAKTKEERKNIILDVRNDWKEFVNKIKGKNG